MAELTAADVSTFTRGRLPTDDGSGETSRMLTAALQVVRRHAGWHVSPIKSETITVDGPDSRMLYLPSRKVVALTAVEEDGTTLDVSTLTWSRGDGPGLMDRPAVVRKKSRGWWTDQYGGITVTFTHGYSELEAADWRQAVMSLVDQIAIATGAGDAGALTRKQVDDVAYSYQPYITLAEETLFSVASILCDYTLPRVEFI